MLSVVFPLVAALFAGQFCEPLSSMRESIFWGFRESTARLVDVEIQATTYEYSYILQLPTMVS